jgi:hypothetical protein
LDEVLPALKRAGYTFDALEPGVPDPAGGANPDSESGFSSATTATAAAASRRLL